jgi:hypothetical protein
MRIQLEYNDVIYKGYYYCTENKVIMGRQNRPIKPIQHKTYRQITVILGTISVQLNYDKVLDKMEEDYQTYLTRLKG